MCPDLILLHFIQRKEVMTGWFMRCLCSLIWDMYHSGSVSGSSCKPFIRACVSSASSYNLL